MALEEYRRKRDFARTPEPSGDGDGARADRAAAALLFPGWDMLPAGRRFCVQMHHASRLHWDFRLEHNGVLLSWAVPKGPSLDPQTKRLAVHVEDHPIDYGDFEGVIPEGYGAGTVMLWDAGEFIWTKESAQSVDDSIARGDVKFRLDGVKLHGEFALVRTGGRIGGRRGAARPVDPADDRNWLLIKKRDDGAVAGMEAADLELSVLSGRTLAEIAVAPAAQWHGKPPDEQPASARRRSSAPPAQAPAPSGPSPAELVAAAPRRRVPASLTPMLAETLAVPFSRQGWLFELKYDGVRAVATVHDGEVRLHARSGRDETKRYPELAELAQALSTRDAVVDGEIVSFDADGSPSFELLQRRINLDDTRNVARVRAEVPAVYMAFDLLGVDGHDLRDLPLRERKRILRSLLRDTDSVRYADHVETEGEPFFAAVAERGLEGMVAKRADSRYEAGRRSGSWVKVRAWRTQDCVVCGYTAGRNSRGDIGALVLGVYENGRLIHCGRAGSGLDEATLRVLRSHFARLHTDVSPFDVVPPTDTKYTWVRPELVCSVRFIGWTREGTMRQPTYRGLRDDIKPEDCVRERELPASAVLKPDPASTETPLRTEPARAPARPGSARATNSDGIPRPDLDRYNAELDVLAQLPANAPWEVGGRQLRLTNLDKPLWTDPLVSKRDMVAYYVRVADAILPHLRDRPVGMQVFPDGIDGKHFWRKRIPDHAPTWIRTWTYHGDRTVTYVIVDDVATLAWMANSAAIDIHPWHSRLDDPERPDWAVFDLDPFPPSTIDDVRAIASLVRAALDHYGLRGYPKVSGQTGVQIHVPIDRGPTQSEVRHWVEEVARAIGRVDPDRVTWEWEVARRTGKIRIDYTQNVVGKTLAAPYSLRPAPGAPVSMPVTWEELEAGDIRPDQWRIDTAPARLRATGDLFTPVLRGGQTLPPLDCAARLVVSLWLPD
jgi:bifunctional non-homologous end joining protein LigD